MVFSTILANSLKSFKKFFKGLFNFKLPREFNLLKIVFNQTGSNYVDNSKNIIINAGRLRGQKKKQLKKLLKESINNDFPILEYKSKKLLDNFINNEKSEKNHELIVTLKKMIPPQDLLAFRSSLFLREKFSKHEDIEELKEDIIRRWGVRGKNICNLCTAYYFENLIIPMYKSFESKYGADGITSFNKIYETIVTETPFILFLQKGDTRGKIKCKIIEKFKTSKEYGAKQLYIHVLGKKVITEIGSVLEEIKEDVGISFDITSALLINK